MSCMCLGEYDGDQATVYSSSHVKARKEHKCYECRRMIAKGETYERVSGLWEGKWETYRFCDCCSEIGLSLSCGGGRTFGMLWEEITDYLFPNMGGDCFDKLDTAKAKQFLRDKWMAWKGLEA